MVTLFLQGSCYDHERSLRGSHAKKHGVRTSPCPRQENELKHSIDTSETVYCERTAQHQQQILLNTILVGRIQNCSTGPIDVRVLILYCLYCHAKLVLLKQNIA